jgi:hypothetical protein
MNTPEEAMELMTIQTQLNDQEARLTLYAIVCPEHGGLVGRNAPDVIEAVEKSNRVSKVMGGCEYHAIAIGLDADLVAELFAAPPEGS